MRNDDETTDTVLPADRVARFLRAILDHSTRTLANVHVFAGGFAVKAYPDKLASEILRGFGGALGLDRIRVRVYRERGPGGDVAVHLGDSYARGLLNGRRATDTSPTYWTRRAAQRQDRLNS